MNKGLILVLLTLSVFIGVDASEHRSFEIPRTEVVEIRDTNYNKAYELYIKLPVGYSNSLNRDSRYPVVYLTDAINNFQVISGATNFPMGSGKMENAILVGISWQKGIGALTSRVRDYTPTVAEDWKRQTGEAANHLAFLRNDVIKYVEKNYRTDPDRRTYFGYSLGGLFGAYILLTQPDTFKNYVLVSPSFWYDDQVIMKIESKFAQKREDLNANVFISIGELETPDLSDTKNNMVGQAEVFYSKLKSRNYKSLSLQLLVVESADHETAFPTAAIRGLYWLFRLTKDNV